MSRVLMVSSEAAPLAKTGGLADVVGSLPKALRTWGDEAAVLIPRYGTIGLKGLKRVYNHLPVHFGPALHDCSVYQAPAEFPFYLLDCPPLYDRKQLYGEAGKDYPDNAVRFAVLCRAALEVARRIFKTEVFHCHDWQSGLVPAYLKTTFATDPTFFGMKTLFTIHNLGYQGLFPPSVMPEIGLDGSLFRPDMLEFWGKVSFIKSGIALADSLNTVSPTYAREIQTEEYGFGLDGALRTRANSLTGILNGADYAEWDPAIDKHLPACYSAGNLDGKRACKRKLLAEFSLPPEAEAQPLIGVVSRLAPQKGADLILDAAAAMLEDSCMVVLGTGDQEYEEGFRKLAAEFPARVAVRIGFDNALAHRIEGGADIFLMPSRYEPCGLSQIYSLKYGTVPVVRATGGLDDTIDKDTGFKFAGDSSAALAAAVGEAVQAFGNPEAWKEMMVRGMAKDFSWNVSAGAYSALYRRLLGGA